MPKLQGVQVYSQISNIAGEKIHGISMRTSNANEFSGDNPKIPSLWSDFLEQRVGAAPTGTTFVVYSSYESDMNGEFQVTIGCNAGPEEGHDGLQIAGGTYIVFQARGPMPEGVIEAWQTAWAYFEKFPDLRRTYNTDFELYSGPEQADIYVGIEP